MLKRYPLVLPLVLSILIHVLVIAAAEVITGISGKVDGKKPDPVSYDSKMPKDDTPAAQAPAAQAPDREKNVEDSKGFEAGILSLETPSPLYRPYHVKVRQRIGKQWQDPRRKGKTGKDGSVLLEFSIKSSGRLLSVEVAESSGVKDLDFSAIKAVKHGAPFAVFPSYILAKKLKMRALFVYD